MVEALSSLIEYCSEYTSLLRVSQLAQSMLVLPVVYLNLFLKELSANVFAHYSF